MSSPSALEREILNGKPVVLPTHGDSMQPLLYDRLTRVVVVRADGKLKPGDLPVYKRPSGQLVMHRIIKCGNEFYYTRGDNRTGLERVPHEWVLGVVVEIFRKNRRISVNSPKYRAYVKLWRLIYPLRFLKKKLARVFGAKRG